MTELEIKNAKRRDREYFLSDIKGLRILIHPSGYKYWQFRYTYQKQRKVISIGTYPQISLLQARKKSLEYRECLLNNQDPQIVKKQEVISKIGNIAGQVHKICEEWILLQEKKELSSGTLKRTKTLIWNVFLPYFSQYDRDRRILTSLNINDISHRDIIEIMLKYQKKSGSDLAKRLFRYIKSIWRYAFNTGLLKNDSVSNIVISEILPPAPITHYPKITDEAILGELLRCIEDYRHSLLIQSALSFVALIPLRSGNLCKLRWGFIDWENQTLTIPRNEMKLNNKNLPDFKLPLSNQAIAILKQIQVFTGWGEWIFHSANNPKKPMVRESLTKALRTMGFNDEKRGRKQLVHSFRGTFRSLCDTHQDEHNASFEIKEAVLDHQVGNLVTRAYNHKADYTEQMRPLLQWWADFLDKIKAK